MLRERTRDNKEKGEREKNMRDNIFM